MGNAETIRSMLLAGEELVRLLVSSPNGAYSIPEQGYIRPANVPSNLMGLVLVNMYDHEGRETRTRIPAMLLGEAAPGSTQGPPGASAPQPATPPAASPTPRPLLPGVQIGAVPSGGTTVPPASSTVVHGPVGGLPPPPPASSVGGLPPPPPLPAQLQADTEDDDDDGASQPELGRELALAQATQLRSMTLQAEEAAGAAIDMEKMTVLREAQYTREVGEAFQLNSAMRREVFATQTAYQEKALRQLDLVDVATRRMLQLSDEVVRRIKDPQFQPAPPPPPPPPPPPDYAGIAIALFQALGKVGAAWSPGSKRKPNRRERQAVLKMLEKASASGPLGLKEVLSEYVNKPGAEPTPRGAQEVNMPSDGTDEKTFSITKKQLLDLVESGAIGALAETGKLAEMIRTDKLDEFVKLINMAGEG